MEKRHKDILRRHRLWLSEQLLVTDSIVPFLFQEDVITEAQAETVEAQVSHKHKVLKLLDILSSRGPRAFPAFLQSLDEFSWVRDRLERDLEQKDPQKDPQPGSADPAPLADPAPPADPALLRAPTDRELSRLASVLGGQWEPVLLELELSAEELYRCGADHPRDAHGAALEGLVLWRRARGRRATLLRLLQGLEAAQVHPSVLMDALD